MKTKTTFQVEFSYYHYDSSNADNGTFLGVKTFKDLDSAIEFKQNLDRVFELKDDPMFFETDAAEFETELLNDFCVCGGYLKSGGTLYIFTTCRTLVDNITPIIE